MSLNNSLSVNNLFDTESHYQDKRHFCHLKKFLIPGHEVAHKLVEYATGD
jgi:hypothetical protein